MTLRLSLPTIWRVPFVLAALTVVGLLSALLGQGGPWWWFSWISLAIPLATIVICLARRRTGQKCSR